MLTLCVSLALEMNSSKRELCSRLIADMYGRVIEPQYMEDAFVALLKQVLASSDCELGECLVDLVDDLMLTKFVISRIFCSVQYAVHNLMTNRIMK